MRSFCRVVVSLAIFTSFPAPAGAGEARPLTVTRLAAISTEGSVSVPLTNGLGVVATSVPLTVHTENGTLYAVRWTDSPEKRALQGGVGGATMAARGDSVLVAFVDIRHDAIRAIESEDGGLTWSAPALVGPRPAGPALPTACVYTSAGEVRRIIAWSAQPSESDGPLVIAQSAGPLWQLTEHPAIRSSGASLYCADEHTPTIVWRDHRDGAGSRAALYHAFVDEDGGLPGEHAVLAPAFDPSICGTEGARFIGYHAAINDAHLARSLDGGVTFTEIDLEPESPAVDPLDGSGKFVAVACDGPVVAATWGDWPTRADAAARAATRMLGMVVSVDGGHAWSRLRPAGGEPDQGPATVAVSGRRILVVWKAPGVIRLAEIAVGATSDGQGRPAPAP